MARTSIGPHAGHITVMVVGGLCRLAKLWCFWWPDLPTLPGWGFLSSRTTLHLTRRTSCSDTFGSGFKPSGNYCHAKWNFWQVAGLWRAISGSDRAIAGATRLG